jgi:hypothetical protein
MEYVMITLRYKDQEVDLELPASVPLFNLIPVLMERLAWGDGSDPSKFVGQAGHSTVRPNETLAQVDVMDGDILELKEAVGQTFNPPTMMAMPEATGKAYLQSLDTKEVFVCIGRSVLIGRSPACPINLSRMPKSDVVSSRHANLVERDDGYWLYDENSTNGTIVDGIYLESGQSIRLREGSQIQFGETGPVFIFYSGESGSQ